MHRNQQSVFLQNSAKVSCSTYNLKIAFPSHLFWTGEQAVLWRVWVLTDHSRTTDHYRRVYGLCRLAASLCDPWRHLAVASTPSSQDSTVWHKADLCLAHCLWAYRGWSLQRASSTSFHQFWNNQSNKYSLIIFMLYVHVTLNFMFFTKVMCL